MTDAQRPSPAGEDGEEDGGIHSVRTSMRMRWWRTTLFRMFAIVIHAMVIRLPNIKPYFDQVRFAAYPSPHLLTYLSPCLKRQSMRITGLLDEAHGPALVCYKLTRKKTDGSEKTTSFQYCYGVYTSTVCGQRRTKERDETVDARNKRTSRIRVLG